MTTSDDPGSRFEVRVTSDSHFAWMRTRMALERTLMAWVRTSVALIGFGFTIVQFFQRLGGMEGVAPALRPQAPRMLGLALIATGVLALLISAWQYRRIVHHLWSPAFRPLAGLGLADKPMDPVVSQTPLLAVIAAVTLIGLFAFFSVLFRMV
jgi:putative membrane protein